MKTLLQQSNNMVMRYLFMAIPYLYLILQKRIEAAKTIVMALAAIMGKERMKIPYSSQRTIPALKIENIESEMSRVERVRITFNNCGMKAMVVRAPAR